MATSILHRASGIVLSVGAPIIVGGLLALMMGPQSWNSFTAHARAWYGQVILFGWSWCFAYHLCNGVRHVVQDFAVGFSKAVFIRNSWISVIGSLLITAAIWACVCMRAAA